MANPIDDSDGSSRDSHETLLPSLSLTLLGGIAPVDDTLQPLPPGLQPASRPHPSGRPATSDPVEPEPLPEPPTGPSLHPIRRVGTFDPTAEPSPDGDAPVPVPAQGTPAAPIIRSA